MSEAHVPEERVKGHIVIRLAVDKVLTRVEADWIRTLWPNLDADALAHPYLRTIPEHTRAILEREAQQCRH